MKEIYEIEEVAMATRLARVVAESADDAMHIWRFYPEKVEVFSDWETDDDTVSINSVIRVRDCGEA